MNYFLGASAGGTTVVVVVVVVVDLPVIGAITGFGASTAGAGLGASSFFLQPAANTVARASTSAKEIIFFIVCSSLF
jgi:hypothetical protein